MPEKKHRIERDAVGEVEIPVDALTGIHAARAVENFDIAGRPVRTELLRAFGHVKLACAITNRDLGFIPGKTFEALEQACRELIDGELARHIEIDALQGGAGTSTNMAVNELIANRALQIHGAKPGDYHIIHPNDTVNLHQSTNDTFPTALKVAALFALGKLENALTSLVQAFQEKEREFADVVKVGRTQLRDAALTTLGREMGAYAEAFGRDRWRVFKSTERLKTVNLGGTAIGTGLGAPRKFIFAAVDNLRKSTKLPLARAENLFEATQNNDSFVEVSGILTACAASMMKISGDLRLLSSGPEAGLGEIKLPPLQAGSSIMPGKFNPVVPEAATQAAIAVAANHSAITHAVANGNLELNPFLPLVADKLLESIALLERAAAALAGKCVAGIEADEKRCAEHVDSSTALLTALVETIGYGKAAEIAETAARSGRTVKQTAIEDGFIDAEAFDALTTPENVNKLGGNTLRSPEK